MREITTRFPNYIFRVYYLSFDFISLNIYRIQNDKYTEIEHNIPKIKVDEFASLDEFSLESMQITNEVSGIINPNGVHLIF